MIVCRVVCCLYRNTVATPVSFYRSSQHPKKICHKQKIICLPFLEKQTLGPIQTYNLVVVRNNCAAHNVLRTSTDNLASVTEMN